MNKGTFQTLLKTKLLSCIIAVVVVTPLARTLSMQKLLLHSPPPKRLNRPPYEGLVSHPARRLNRPRGLVLYPAERGIYGVK